MATTVVIYAGGPPPSARVPSGDGFVIAADSGLHAARACGERVDLVVGDFDSVDPEVLSAAAADGTHVERHPTDKDATDLELAFLAAQRRGAEYVTVVAGFGGRIDHQLSVLLLLASLPDFTALVIDARIGDSQVLVLHGGTRSGERQLAAAVGDVVTLLAVNGLAEGVTTGGLQYSLSDETLRPGSSRGVSNVVTEAPAAVALRAGTLLVITTGAPA